MHDVLYVRLELTEMGMASLDEFVELKGQADTSSVNGKGNMTECIWYLV